MEVGRALADLEGLLVRGLEEAVADAVAVQARREVLQAELALKVAPALRRGESETRLCCSMGMGTMTCVLAAMFILEEILQASPWNESGWRIGSGERMKSRLFKTASVSFSRTVFASLWR